MFCIVAFIVLAILGIFSASYRELAKDALDCVLRRVTLRPCTTGFDVKMKSRILGSVVNRSETVARVLNKNFELLSWLFFMLMLASSLFAARGLYLFYVTGSCNGSNQSSFCLFDPKGENNQVTAVSESCKDTPTTLADLTLQGVNLAGFPTLNGGGKERIVLLGCYGCSYTRKTYPTIKELAIKNGAVFTFIDYPVKVRTTLAARLGQCVYQRDQAKYWKLNDILFAANVDSLDDMAFAKKATAELGLDWGEIGSCLSDPATEDRVGRQMDEATKTKFYGTPTVFVNNQAFVGPKPYRVYAISLHGLLYWLK
jgi:protein-disulfide isomerase